MLGAALQNAFREEAGLIRRSFPGPNIKSGSFIYNKVLSTKGWSPNVKELRTFSAEMVRLSGKDLKIERLDVVENLASEMFKDSKYKLQQIPNIASNNHGNVT